jgi:uncharacterized protein
MSEGDGNMEVVVANGKDVATAIEMGLGILNAKKEEVNIKVIRSQSKGFLGIGSKMAIVKLTKRSPKPLPTAEQEYTSRQLSLGEIKRAEDETKGAADENRMPSAETQDTNLGGKAWVKNGELYFQTSVTQYPAVTINSGVKLYKNNQVVEQEMIVLSELDEYEMITVNEEKRTSWKISLDRLKLKAYLEIESGYKIIRHVQDCEPAHHIELKLIEQKEIYHTLTYEDILREKVSLSIKYGINEVEILKAVHAKESGIYEIASGIEPVQGKNGRVELKINLTSYHGPKEQENGIVDFHEMRFDPAVEIGQVIAIVHPPIPGKPGVTVTNEQIPPIKVYPIVLRLGQGVLLDNDKIVTIEKGRPKIEQRGQLFNASIMPNLIHQGNVDLSTGNIHFKGDVEILGEVKESMAVEAEGDIVVHQTSNMAKLTASGCIIAFNPIIGSEISAGKNNMLIAELGHLLGILHQYVEKMIGVINQLLHSPAFKSNNFRQVGLQPLIRLLLEKKFKGFSVLAKKYTMVERRAEQYLADDEWSDIGISITRIFLTLTNEVISLEQIVQLSQKMKELHEFSQTPVEPNSYITIPSALNSKFYCSGNILIVGQGCINSKIHAGGKLKISGVLRGGSVYARLGAEINEAGSKSCTSTVITVPSDQKVSIHKVMEGTILKIGNTRYAFNKTASNVRARLDSNDRITFE